MTKKQMLETIIPDSLFNVQDPTTGQINFDRTQELIDEKVTAFLDTVKLPEIPTLPSVSLIPKIPAIVLPSPAEIAEYVLLKIEEKKKQLQEQTIKAQLVAAIQDESPFTNSAQLLNKQTARLPNAISNGRL